ncbi:hypothetical protein GPAL_3080 [Glaciecola pallidula DSM 14239 = ACAM 615]|uniref:Uncharacterized protein n=1 Tax=Brumicola pallidula DSM 14239 = ACAM 615 TaxID=1121922 RepID=K6Z170_9ALTE|nr:hypothetical protein GPAL_3080 [Glaciecola pallidula DSM 14239 = ACAM 615]
MNNKAKQAWTQLGTNKLVNLNSFSLFCPPDWGFCVQCKSVLHFQTWFFYQSSSQNKQVQATDLRTI